MSLDAGKLRHRLMLLGKASTQDSTTGEVIELWSELGAVWGSFEPFSTKDVIAAASLQEKTVARAVIRHKEGLPTDLRLSFRGKLYEVVGPPLSDPDSGLEYMTLMLKEIAVSEEDSDD